MSTHLSPAYQLYSAREDASNDLEGVLDQLSRMGYEGVEFAGFFERSAKEVRKLLRHAGLKAVSSHVPLQQIRDDAQSVLDYHEAVSYTHLAYGYVPLAMPVMEISTSTPVSMRWRTMCGSAA